MESANLHARLIIGLYKYSLGPESLRGEFGETGK